MKHTLVFIFLSLQLLFANITIEDNITVIDDFNIKVYESLNKQDSIETISKKEFSTTIKNGFSLNYKSGDLWFKFEINNKSQYKELILFFNEAVYDYLYLYTYENNQWIKHTSSYAHPSFKIKLQENQTFYIQAHTKFQAFGAFKLYLDESKFLKEKQNLLMLYGYFFGIVILITLYTLFLFFTLKRKVYLLYTAYTICFGLFIFYFSGFASMYGLHDTMYYVAGVPTAAITFFILFSIEFLNLKEFIPKISKLLKIYSLLFIIIALLISVDMKYFYLTNIIATPLYAIVILVTIYLIIQKHPTALIYFIALVIYLTSLSTSILMFDSRLEYSEFKRYIFMYGSLLELIIFSMMLTKHFYNIQKKYIRLKEEQQIVLENKVKQRTQEIEEHLHEKSILLKEVYHRVKNNFQMVIGLIGLETYKTKSPEHKERLKEVIGRLKSISLVHEFLYNSKSLASINSETYLLKIINQTEAVYAGKNIQIDSEIEASLLNMDDAIILGMIVNELISNSIKHNDKAVCHIYISLKNYHAHTVLIIKDNGKGFSRDLLVNSSGLGLNLIKDFAKKLKSAEYHFQTDNGTYFELKFLQ